MAHRRREKSQRPRRGQARTRAPPNNPSIRKTQRFVSGISQTKWRLILYRGFGSNTCLRSTIVPASRRPATRPHQADRSSSEMNPGRLDGRVRDRRVDHPGIRGGWSRAVHRRPSGSDGSRSGPRSGILGMRTPAHDPRVVATLNLARHGPPSKARLPRFNTRRAQQIQLGRRSDERVRIPWERWITGRASAGHDDRDGSEHDQEAETSEHRAGLARRGGHSSGAAGHGGRIAGTRARWR